MAQHLNSARTRRQRASSSEDGERAFELNTKQYDFVYDDLHKYVAYLGGIGAGKALALDTPIPTPDGWTTMGQIQPGDTVFDDHGQPCKVIWATDVMDGHTCYEVVFGDGTTIVADAEHQWVTWTWDARRNAHRNPGGPKSQPATVTTEQMRETLKLRAMTNHAISATPPIECAHQKLPIDPYVLGVWLGDGTSVFAKVTTADPEVVAEVRAAGYGARLVPSTVGSHGKAVTYCVGGAAPRRDPITGRMMANGSLQSTLRRVGLLGNKHVPRQYLRGDAGQRLALLQGLMDSDGTAGTDGVCTFACTNKALSDAVYELCGSLGIRAVRRQRPARLYDKVCGISFQVEFVADFPVFRLPRKGSRQRFDVEHASRRHLHYITDVRPCETTPVRCISVDSPSHCYLVSRAFIATHNSFAGAVKALRKMVECPGSVGVIGAPTYPQLRDSTMRVVSEVFPPLLVADFNKHEGLLTLTNGSEAMFRSMSDPEDRRGPNLAWYWLDEGPLCGYYAWQIMKGRTRDGRFPVQAWITGTPHGEDEFYEDFEHEVRPGHALYRASTRENQHNLPDGFIDDLGYEGQFALQEIEGLFVSFEGLVYEFVPEWHVGEWPAGADGTAKPRPQLRIGGVDWGYTNPAVALPIWVDGDDRAFVLDEYYQRQAGLAGVKTAILEQTREYGIQTWYCGPDEPEHIAELNAAFGREKLSARAVAATDDIVPGIETVRRQMVRRDDGTVGLSISAKCVNLRAEFRTYSYPSSHGSRTKRDPQDKPVKAFDHALDACFVAGTMVRTEHGELPIEQVRPSMRVWTRQGLRRLCAAGMTQESAPIWTVEFGDGTVLQGTANHPIWVDGQGWTPLAALKAGDELHAWKQIASPSTALSIGAILRRSAGQIDRTTRQVARTAARALAGFIRRSGRRLTAPFQPGATSTIATATRSTMTWRTWNVWRNPSTSASTAVSPQSVSASILSVFDRWLLSGIAPRPGALGIASMPSSCAVRNRSSASASVPTAGSHSEITRLGAGASAPMRASQPGDGALGVMMSSSPASIVGTNSAQTGMPKRGTAPIHVRYVHPGLRAEPVYNLTVERTPEYFANGVLVHNCRYALHTALGGKTRHRGFTEAQWREMNGAYPVSSIGGVRVLKKTF